METNQELKKLKEMLVKVKKKYELDLEREDQSEIEKDKRIMILLLDKIKEKKKQMDVVSEVQNVSTNIQDDKKANSKFFAKDSHRKSSKKIHFFTIISMLLIFIYGVVCTSQFFLYKRALYLQTHFNEKYPLAIYNTNYMAKFFGVLILVYFAIYAMNYKNMKYRKIILFLGFSGMIFGILSYGGVGKMDKFIFSGKGLGIIPGIILLICSYFLARNIITYKTKKINSITKSKEFKTLDKDPDQKKIEDLKRKEEFTKKMQKEKILKIKKERELKEKKKEEELRRRIYEDEKQRKIRAKQLKEKRKKEQEKLEKQMEEDIEKMEKQLQKNEKNF